MGDWLAAPCAKAFGMDVKAGSRQGIIKKGIVKPDGGHRIFATQMPAGLTVGLFERLEAGITVRM